MKDIQVFTALDAKTVAAEKLDILLLSTEGAADMATYNDLEKLKAAFPGKKVAAMADKMFNQDNTLADTLIRKVRVAGIENPQNVGGTASRIEIAFGENMPTETLEASTAYYAKIGGKAVVEITTGEEVPVDCTGLAKLFAGTSFEEDGVKFTAAVDDNTVTYTSTTRTAVSGYAESISLYKDADCFEDMGLSGAVVSVSVGKADTTKAENLIAAIEDLRDHNDDWYFILTDVTDPVCVTALCKWAESTEPTEAALGAGVEDAYKYDVLAGFVDLSGYVEKEAGKGLSDENFTAALKDKLDGIAAGANKYVHPTHTAAASGLYKTTVDEEGHVTATTPVTKDDITKLGIPAQDTTYDEATTAKAGLMSAADKTKLDGMGATINKAIADHTATDAEVSEMLAEVYGE